MDALMLLMLASGDWLAAVTIPAVMTAPTDIAHIPYCHAHCVTLLRATCGMYCFRVLELLISDLVGFIVQGLPWSSACPSSFTIYCSTHQIHATLLLLYLRMLRSLLPRVVASVALWLESLRHNKIKF